MRRRSAAALALALLLPLPGLAGEVVVKPGETLSEIAERYGTTVQRLMQLNNLRSPQDLWAGSRIQVPGAAGSSASRGGGSGNYTVKPGETLSEIAERYGTSVQRLMQLNGLRNPQDLWAGSRIQVPGAAGASGSGGTRTTTVNANYTVKPGETLSELAERYGTSVQRLMQLNGLSSPQDLWAGSRIQVPVTRTSTAAAPKPAVNKNATQHKVQSGESLSVIANRYGVSLQNLVAINNISDPNQVVVGQTLKLRGTPAPKPAAKPAPKPVAAKPAPKPQPQPVASKPAPQPAPKPAVQPTAQPVAAKPAATPVASQPEPKPAVANTAPVAAQPETKPEPQPQPKAEVKPAVTTVAAKPATKPEATASSAKSGKPAAPDWRNYGPLQVDWANWQPMGGSYVAPSLNSDGQPLYLAINCNAKRLNATGQSGSWKTWDAPQSDFEHKLINDLCTAKGG
ncbi:MAG: LysM peptidoglycan-binding domain-containing protein [Vulcanococcus sp.]